MMILSIARYKLLYITVFSLIVSILTIILSSNIVRINNLALILTAIPCASYLAISFVKGKVDILHPFFVYPISYFVIFGIGGNLHNSYGYQDQILNSCIILGLVGYLLGFLFYLITIRHNRQENNTQLPENAIKKLVHYSVKFERYIFLIGIFAFLLYVIRIGNLPILMANLEQSRVDASIAGGAYLRILTYFLIVSSIIGFFNYVFLKKQGIKSSKISIVVFITGIVALFLLSNRSPVFMIICSTMLTYLLIYKNGYIKFRNFIVFMSILTLAVIVFVGGIGAYRVINTEEFYSYPEYYQYIRNADYFGLSLFIFKHYLGIGYADFGNVINIFPRSMDFMYGSSYFEPLMTVLPGTQYTLDMQIKQALGQTYLGGGTIPSALGEAYANFGYVGCLIVPFLTFFMLCSFYRIFQKNKNSPFHMLFYIFFLYYMSFNLLAGYASTSIFPFVSIVLYLIYRMVLKTPGKMVLG